MQAAHGLAADRLKLSTKALSWLDAYAFPFVADVPDGHSCDEPPMEPFKIRGKHYVTKGHPQKGKKGPSALAAFKLPLLERGLATIALVGLSTPSASLTAPRDRHPP